MGSARVLVVEDEALIALDTQKTLENLGYEVTAIAYSGEEAIRLAEETRPDIILMDIILKDEMSGIETVRVIHEKQDIPVIYMTANADIATIEEARETGPYGYLNKPFGDRDLYSAIDTALYKHQMESRLQQSQQQLLDMMEAAPAAIIVYDRGGISYVNQECEKILGLKKDSITGKNLWEFIDPEHRDLVKSRVQSTLDHEEYTPVEYDASIISNSGEEYWMHFKTTYTTYNDTDSVLVHGLDISLQKNIEALLLKKTEELEATNEEMQSTIEEMEAVNEEFEATNEELTATNQDLHESQQRYSSLFKYSKTPMLIIDPDDGSIVDANEAASIFYGYDGDILLKMNINQINLLSEDEVRCEMKIASSESRSYFVFRHQLSNDSIRDVEVYTGPILLEGKEYLYSIIHDITDRIEAEKKLHYATILIQNSPAILFRWQNQENWPTVFVTENVTRFGYTTDEILTGKVPFSSMVHPDDIERVKKEVGLYSSAGHERFQQEYRIIGKNGNIFWVDDRTTIERNDTGSITHYDGVVIDITEKKLLEENYKFHSMLLNQIQDLVTATDLDGNITFVNDAECRMLQKSREELIGKPVSQYGDDATMGATQDEIYQTVKKEGSWRGEVVNYDANDNRVILDSRVWKILNENGYEMGLCGIATDITEKKKMEESLKENEERFRAVFNMMNAGIAIADTKGNWIDINDRACALLGYSREELLQKSNMDITHPDDTDITKDYMAELIAGKRHSFQVEKRYISKQGDIIWVDLYIKALRDDENNLKGLMGVTIDITDRKNAEKELLRSEKEKSLILNSTYEVYCYYNEELQIQWANKAAADSVSMNLENMVGLNCYRLWHNRETPCENCPVLKAKETGKAQESEINTPDGRTWFLRGFPVFDENGEIAALVEFGQDITGRKEAEQQVLQALREKETLLQEIHHRVKNNFQVITSLLNFQSRSIKDPQMKNKVEEIQQRIRAMALIHEKLYQSGNFTTIDFKQYASIIVTELNYAYSRQMDESLKTMVINIEDITLNIEKAIPCGLIINELVSNSLKHAFPDDTIEDPRITIAMEESEDSIHLHVSDNGVGLPPGIDPEKTQSMGMSLVPLLINQLNGTMEVDTSEGTTYNITFEK